MSSNQRRYGYCKIYVQSHDRALVLGLLETHTHAVGSVDYAVAGGIEFDILDNPDADNSRGDDFLYWPTTVDVTNEDPVDLEVVHVMDSLLRGAWDSGVPMVVACPFEEELPWSGGIERAQ